MEVKNVKISQNLEDKCFFPILSPTERRMAPYVWFNVQQAQYTTNLQWNRISNLEPSAPKVETLPLDPSCPRLPNRRSMASRSDSSKYLSYVQAWCSLYLSLVERHRVGEV
ncbi:hypothetical protein AVEN_224959-1 [Araneus ventricosus]|uniref:Uncharacterized protein n=1 Tax=Araneus ventricosus TaxID=182803 RepID=A0A4Y2TY88_ARAVE|nr:hypothetical protein AVEN_224959-1 [Araneus ventricosus]